MLLPRTNDKAAMRALDKECAKPHSVASKRVVNLLAAQPPSYKESFLLDSTVNELGNLVRCALEAGASPDTATESVPVLLLAATGGTTRALKTLLAGGANKELVDKFGNTALACAARQRQLSCLQLLLDAGANANAPDCFGNTPLMHAVTSKQVDCARALLPASDLGIRGHAGHTALHMAVNTASEACFELLLPLYDVDVRTVPAFDVRTGEALRDFNKTALHLACLTGHLTMCKALLSRGADRMARDSKQFTPLHFAAGNGHLSCVVMLVGRPGKVLMTPAEVGAVTGNGATALHWAARFGFDQICAVLLAAGARLDAKTSDGDTPFMLAQQEHPTNTVLHALLSGDAPAQPLGLVCDHCGKTAEQASVRSLKDCGKCYAVRYCGKECQLAAWPGHRAACKARVEEREEKARASIVDVEVT